MQWSVRARSVYKSERDIPATEIGRANRARAEPKGELSRTSRSSKNAAKCRRGGFLVLSASPRSRLLRGDAREQARHSFEQQREGDQDENRTQRREQRRHMCRRGSARDQRIRELEHDRYGHEGSGNRQREFDRVCQSERELPQGAMRKTRRRSERGRDTRSTSPLQEEQRHQQRQQRAERRRLFIDDR